MWGWRGPTLLRAPLFLLVVTLLVGPGLAQARTVPPLTGRVQDEAALLSPEARQRIDGMLFAYQQQTGHQLALLTVRSLEGDALEEFSLRVVEAWQLGDKQRDDGVLLLVSVAERKLRIEVGYGLEGELPDATTSRIIRDIITPAFRRGDPDAGIVAGLQAIMAATGGKDVAIPAELPRQRSRARDGEAPGGIVLLLLLGLVVMMFLGRGGRGGRSAAWGAVPFLLGGRSGGGFGGGGSRGGGGFGGGGGGFGGGGASGDW
ncbi:MAG: hypothetical protein RL685_2358 [Pseudomonadota bacterium]|jgi:uncharacterized protein